jgi:hypothetical protein
VLPHPAVCHSHPLARASYERRQPETTLLYKTLQEHWLGFLAEIEAEGGELPAFVKDEFAAYFRWWHPCARSASRSLPGLRAQP